MTTSTLELVDWATILDDEPACERAAGCPNRATHILRTVCGCSAARCMPCCEHWLRKYADLLPMTYVCLGCRTETPCWSIAELVTVVPL